MSYPNDWMQLNFNDANQPNIPPATTAATTTTAISINNDPAVDHGRGGARPIRRRSRASRRTPTTLLNTDTTNFRAMVQQFTGSPTTAASAAPHLANAAGMFDFTQHIAGHVPSNMYHGRGVHVQYPNHMQQQQQHMFMVGGDMHGRGGGGAHAPPESSPPNESRDYDNYML